MNSILIIERKMKVAAMLSTYLTACGYKVEVEIDGSKKTQALMRKKHFDIVMADINLKWDPILLGHGDFHHKGRQTGVILVTTGCFISDSFFKGFYGMFGQKIILIRPFSLFELKQVIEDILYNIKFESKYFADMQTKEQLQ